MNNLASTMVRLLVRGERACFRRPEMTSDLISYDAMPPTVARQLIKAALGDHHWVVERIVVCEPIHFGWDRLTTARGEKRAMVLTNVAYMVEARSSSYDQAMPSGQLIASVHLGLTNYSATAKVLCDDEPPSLKLVGSGHIDLGWMIYDTAGSRSRFFRAFMIDGVMTVGRIENVLLAS